MKKILIISSCAFLLPPTAIAFISCSNPSSTTPPSNKEQISAKNNIKASDLNLRYLYEIDNNWIFSNKEKLLNGSLDKISADSIKDIQANIDSQTKTIINLNFKIKSGHSYQTNGDLSSTDTPINIKILNFELIPTDIKNSVNATDIGVNNLTRLHFYAQYQEPSNVKIKSFVLDNINHFVTGEFLNKDNINVRFEPNSNSSEQSIILKITINGNSWYDANKNLQSSPLIKDIKITNFKELPNELDPAGGSIDEGRLSTSKYKNIINLLQLKHQTPLPSLSNDNINIPLKAIDEFKNLTLKISSKTTTKNSILYLTLNGQYKNQTINNEEIKIEGFLNFNQISNQIEIKNIYLNNDNWFNDLKPIFTTINKNEINNITSEQWKNTYLNNFVFSWNENNLNINKDTLIYLGLNFDIRGQNNNGKIKFNFENIWYQNKKYENNQWIDDDSRKEFNVVAGRSPEIEFPKIDKVKEYLISKTEIDEEEMKKHYPSFYLGQSYFYKKINSLWPTNNSIINTKLESIKNTYFKGQNVSINFLNNETTRADDFANKLSFSVSLVIDGTQEQIYSKSFQLENKNKNINNEELINTSKENRVVIKPKNNFFIRIKNYLKNNYKAQIDEMFQNQKEFSFNFNAKKIQIIPDIITRSLIRYEDKQENVSNNWDNVNKSISTSIFNNEINLDFEQSIDNSTKKDNTLNFHSRLFWNKTNAFVIESINYAFDDNLKIKVSMDGSHGSLINITFQAETHIDFANNNSKVYKTSFSMNLLKSQWQ